MSPNLHKVKNIYQNTPLHWAYTKAINVTNHKVNIFSKYKYKGEDNDTFFLQIIIVTSTLKILCPTHLSDIVEKNNDLDKLVTYQITNPLTAAGI